MITEMLSIPEQLTNIYFNEEPWHVTRMGNAEALKYHEQRFKSGEIKVYEENGEVLGYFQRHYVYNVCFIDNAWIKKDCRRGFVFRSLNTLFYETLPGQITHIMGHRQNKLHKVKIRRQR